MILEFIGALIRFVCTSFINRIKGIDSISFSEFIKEPKNGFKIMDKNASDTFIGAIFLIFVLILIYLLS